MDKTTKVQDMVDAIATEIEIVTNPLSVQTTLVDGIKGVAVHGGLVRISFFEAVFDTMAEGEGAGVMKGRHVVNIAMDSAALDSVLDLLTKVNVDIKAMKGEVVGG